MDSSNYLCLAIRALIVTSILQLSLSAEEAVPQKTPNAIGLQVNEAYDLFKEGQANQALEQFQAALSHDAQDLQAQLGQAMIFADQQRHADAFTSYDIIVKQHPKHAFAWNGRGRAAFSMEDFDEALHSHKQATLNQPANGFFYESLAWTQMCRGEYAEAIRSAKTAMLIYNKKREGSIYPVLIAYFAYLESGDKTNAKKTLYYAFENKPVNRWPEPIVDYLAGVSNRAQLISCVSNKIEETEAHAYIGLHNRILGNPVTAKKHLDWVIKNGESRIFEYTLSRALNLQESVALIAP